MCGLGKVIGTAKTLVEAREIAKNNKNASESIQVVINPKTKEEEFIVKQLTPSELNRAKQRVSADFEGSIVEFSIEDKGEESVIISPNMFGEDWRRSTAADIIEGTDNLADNLIDGAAYLGNKVNDAAEYVTNKVTEGTNSVSDKLSEAASYIKYQANKIIQGETLPPKDGKIFEGNVSPAVINDIKSGKVQLPIYIKIINAKTNETSYVQINKAVIDSLKTVEFPLAAQKKYGFSDTQDTRDGTVTKGYGCTDRTLHKYLVPGKDTKAEKAAEAVLIYQAITHAQERFNHIPKALLDNLDDSHKLGLLSSGFNMSAGMFVGGTSKDPKANSPNGFQPVKQMQEYWNTITKGDGSLSVSDIKAAINKSFGSFISGGVSAKQSGLYPRRVFDFILSLGGNPGVQSPYGEQKKLSESLKNMLVSEQDPAKKSSIQAVITDLKKIPSWKNFLT